MKLLRYGRPGEEKPGLLDGDGAIRDLSAHIADLTPATITIEAIEGLKAIDPASLPKIEGEQRCGIPVNGIGKFIAIGLN
jgi:hypothetical protein